MIGAFYWPECMLQMIHWYWLLTLTWIMSAGDKARRKYWYYWKLKELNGMGVVGTKERSLLVGDLNQQREHDYTSDEWEQIRSGMEHRRSCEDDGVAKLLMDQGFVCAWDSAPPPKTNWETSRPPATHWSGTIVDYSYGCNISPITMSISPAGWSDHRMTVCDWNWK